MGTKNEAEEVRLSDDEEEGGCIIDVSCMFDKSRRVYTRESIDTSREQRILTGMIISDEVCKRVMPMVDPYYFQMNPSKVIFLWIKE